MLRSITAAALTAAFLAAGCSDTSRAPRTIPLTGESDALEQARSLLQRYAEGQAPASEVTSFPEMVSEVKKTNPAKAEILEKGLDEIQKNPSQAKAKAKELLGKLQPSAK